MNKGRANSSPELLPQFISTRQNDSSLEGVATNVKLLLKLIQEHTEACQKDEYGRNSQRIAGMISILDDVKTRIEKLKNSGRQAVELRRCNTDLRRSPAPRDKKTPEPATTEDSNKLQKELAASLAARNSLQKMFSSLGKEKQIMAAELARKVQQTNDMEEHLNDLKAQNETLMEKLQACASKQHENKSSSYSRDSTEGNQVLQEQNKSLSEQLLKSLHAYRSLKRRLNETQDENSKLHENMAEVTQEVAVGLEKFHDFRQRVATGKEKTINIEEELWAVERMFQQFEGKVAMCSECLNKANAHDITAKNTSLVA